MIRNSTNHNLYILLYLVIFLATPSVFVAQQDSPSAPVVEQPIENSDKNHSLFRNNTEGIPVPPRSKVRAMAEWEELEAVVIAWSSQWAGTNQAAYDTLLAQIAFHARQECNVNILF
jgi:hypothetical protein